MPIFNLTINSPVGQLLLQSNGIELTDIIIKPYDHSHSITCPILLETSNQLTEYFQGKRQHFQLPLKMKGTTFQQQAWKTLLSIPFGSTISYQEQGLRMKNPKAVRAIGQANGKNPLPIIVPCHRVVGKNGHLTGYSSGLDIKSFLLQLEGKHLSGKNHD
jgi:methylated-DNA-[protein]-cysteine S-methyltransferase